MSVARVDREVSSPEFTRWIAYYRRLDLAKAGKLDDHEEGMERGE